MRALIVHPSITIRRAIRSAMVQAGHPEVVEARTGEQAIALVQQFTVGLIVLGYDLGPMTGTELAQYIRDMHGHRRTPMIMVSDSRLARDVLSAADSGIASYVALPFSQRILVDKVRVAVERAATISAAVTAVARGPIVHQEVFLY